MWIQVYFVLVLCKCVLFHVSIYPYLLKYISKINPCLQTTVFDRHREVAIVKCYISNLVYYPVSGASHYIDI